MRSDQWITCLAFAAMFASAGVSMAEETCGPASLETAVVSSINPAGDISLTDGRQIRLAGLKLAHPARDIARQGDRLAIGILGDADRWNRLPAIAFQIGQAGEPVFLQQKLILRGLATIRPETDLGPCWALLTRIESESGHLLPLKAESGRFARAEGKVTRVGEGRTAYFINVVERSGSRVTGLVQKRHLSRFMNGNVDVKALAGQTIRLRGVRNLRNSEVIALTRVDQIEIIK